VNRDALSVIVRRIVVAMALGVALCGPAAAHESPPLGADLFGGIVRDSDVDLVFDYLRESTRAALEGREAPVPDALSSRAEQMAEEVRRRGGVAARVFIEVIERSVRDAMRDGPQAPHLPPSYPSGQRI